MGDAGHGDAGLIEALIEPFDSAEAEERAYASSETTYHAIAVSPSDWVAFATHALAMGFDTFIDLFAVDHFSEAPRFEVTLNLLSMSVNERILISTRVPYDDPSVQTLTDVFAGANFYEREAYDLLGIDFPGHPDLTRILMPDDWEGHPLRKDYDLGAVPVEFKAGSSDL
jgi:NADH-quinone oxidoreductase subunit C